MGVALRQYLAFPKTLGLRLAASNCLRVSVSCTETGSGDKQEHTNACKFRLFRADYFVAGAATPRKRRYKLQACWVKKPGGAL